MKRRRFITKRRCIMLMLMLLLVGGAIVNVAVAWVCALWPGPSTFNNPRVPGHYDFVDAQGNRTWLIVRFGSLHLMQIAPPFLQPHELPTRIDEPTYQAILPDWSAFAHGTPTGTQPDPNGVVREVVVYEEDAIGWPAYAFRSSGQRTGTGVDFSTTGWRFQQQLPLWFRKMHLRDSLPIEPCFAGFVINTAFYAAVLWLLFAAPSALRRRMRIKRGLCPKCAYDLRGRVSSSTVCPECGGDAAVVKQAKHQTHR